MPELPEVETIRRDLEKEVVGKRIKTVEVTGMRSIRRHTQQEAVHRPARGPEDRRASSAGASTCCSPLDPATCSSSTWA